MNNRFENPNRSPSHLMTQLTREALERQVSDLEEKLKQHLLETGKAMDKGDEYHDNFAFEEANRMVDMTSSMLSQVKDKLRDVTIIEPRQQVDSISVGNAIVLRFAGETEDETFTLLGPDDIIFKKAGWISYESPLGGMLMGKKEGDRIEYQIANGNPQQITIKKIQPGKF